MVMDDEREDRRNAPLEESDAQDPAREESSADGDASSGPVTPGQLLRTALVDDEDPRFPRWLPIPGVLLGLAWAGYQATAGDAGALPTLGVSIAIFAGTTLATWLGWQLEID